MKAPDLKVYRVVRWSITAGKGACWLLSRLGEIGDPLSKWATIAAIIGGGVWAIYQYSAAGARDWAINMSITTEVIPYHDNLALLVVHVHPQNPRTNYVDLDPKRDKYVLTIRQVPEDRHEGDVLDSEDPVKSGMIDKTIPMMPEGGYTFLPGASFEDTTSLIVPFNTRLWVTAEIDYKGDYVVTSDIVDVKDAKAVGNAQSTDSSHPH